MLVGDVVVSGRGVRRGAQGVRENRCDESHTRLRFGGPVQLKSPGVDRVASMTAACAGA